MGAKVQSCDSSLQVLKQGQLQIFDRGEEVLTKAHSHTQQAYILQRIRVYGA